MNKIKVVTLMVFAVIACGRKESGEIEKTKVKDEHSFAEPEKAIVKHLNLDIKVDFGTQTFSGKASWDIDNIGKADEIVFD
jgi:hypothetical protein